MPVLDLRAQARHRAFALPACLSLSQSERDAAIETWRGRMVNEHISARVFAALLPQMMKAGVSADQQAAVAEMISQELSHGRLCAAVVTALGGDPIAELPALPDVPAHKDAAPVEALLRNVLAISCLNETVAVAVLEAERHRADPEPLQEIIREILADEVGHARFGWRLLEELAPRLDPAAGRRLAQYLIVAFRQLISRHYVDQEGPAPSGAAGALGVCDDRLATAMFLDTVAEVIIPGLESHGIQASAAWQRALAA